jgi:predicted XRE-type DNA-binding protein
MRFKEQRKFCRVVEQRIKEKGLLYKFVASGIHISESRLSQFFRSFRIMPTNVRANLIKFLQMEDVVISARDVK